jgi:hypothetical protein
MRKHARQRPRKIQEHRQTGQHSFEDGYAPSLPWDHECRRSQGVTPGDQDVLDQFDVPARPNPRRGLGFWVEMWVDSQAVHATGDVPILGGLLGSSLGTGLKQIVQQTFQKKLP